MMYTFVQQRVCIFLWLLLNLAIIWIEKLLSFISISISMPIVVSGQTTKYHSFSAIQFDSKQRDGIGAGKKHTYTTIRFNYFSILSICKIFI